MPLALYIKEWRRGGPALSWRTQGGSPTPGGSRIPPSLVGVGEGRKGERERRKGGPAPLPIRIGLGGTPPPWRPPPPFHYGPLRPIDSPGGSGNPSVLRYMLNSLETFLMSKHSHPIYRSLCLDHFETPRHVRDHIRDSELPSVHQNT